MPSNKPTTNAPRADQPQPAISAYALLVGLLLSGAMVGLNHDFDIVGGRFEETVTAGGGLDDQAEVEQSSANLSLRRKLGFLAFLAVGGLALVGPKSGARFQLNALAILSTAALAWAGASLLWSVDRHETFRELVRLYAYVVVAVLLARRFGVRELVAMMLIVCLISIAVDVAADIVAGTFQPWRSEFRLGGALHPNHIGRLGAIVAVAGCAALREPGLRRGSWLLVGLGTVVVVGSLSRSALAGLAAGLLAVHLLGVAGRRLAFYATSLAAVAAVGLMVYAVTPSPVKRDVRFALLMGRTDDVGSLTGRVPLWQEMWRDLANRKWTGVGYGAYWTVEKNYELGSVIHWYPRHSHSVYMELLADLGLVGLSLSVVLGLAAVARFARWAVATDRWEYRFLGALLVSGFANGVFEVGFGWPRLEGLFVGMAILVLFLRQAEAVPAADAADAPAARTVRSRSPLVLRRKPFQRPT